jgi:hypothetical protein
LQRATLGLKVEAAFGAPYYHFHRADLVNFWPLPCRKGICISATSLQGRAEGRARSRSIREWRDGGSGPFGQRRWHPFTCARSRLWSRGGALHRLRLARVSAERITHLDI